MRIINKLMDNPSLIRKGMIAILAMTLSTVATAATSYRVKDGDTLSSIAKQYDTTLQKLIEINNLKNANDVKIGDLIYLNDTRAIYYQGKTMTYVVQSGDSISSIARKFDTTTSTLSELNDGDLSQFRIGTKLTVPMQTIKTDEVKAQPATASNVKTFTYVVQSNETLRGVANKFDIGIRELAKLNNLDIMSLIYRDQRLLIPSTPARLKIVENDRLSSQAKTVATTKATAITPITVKSSNAVSTSTKTPAKSATKNPTTETRSNLLDFTTYQIQKGDSLIVLAKRYNTTVAGLAKINNIEPTASLVAGKILTVPNIQPIKPISTTKMNDRNTYD
ncbi:MULTISPECIES: LysM peptidoglycan-binding domain-containing protein [unclassified Moraxella]|uniref:LysM peptidoglycan-binding domain-containing protein n=1 Tax=unclassified Moraxella TaxID=2685852 RepID=UPI003AF6555B